MTSLSRSHFLSQVLELTGRATRLTKERDSALSKMSLWMKTCKQLEQEKEEMINGTGMGTYQLV